MSSVSINHWYTFQGNIIWRDDPFNCCFFLENWYDRESDSGSGHHSTQGQRRGPALQADPPLGSSNYALWANPPASSSKHFSPYSDTFPLLNHPAELAVGCWTGQGGRVTTNNGFCFSLLEILLSCARTNEPISSLTRPAGWPTQPAGPAVD
jgi:hypothetical protein